MNGNRQIYNRVEVELQDCSEPAVPSGTALDLRRSTPNMDIFILTVMMVCDLTRLIIEMIYATTRLIYLGGKAILHDYSCRIHGLPTSLEHHSRPVKILLRFGGPTSDELHQVRSNPMHSLTSAVECKTKENKRRVKNKKRMFVSLGPSTTNIARVEHSDHGGNQHPTASRGAAYGYWWEPFGTGARLSNGEMVAAHLMEPEHHDITLKGFPDMISLTVPDIVQFGDTIEYWNGRRLQLAKVDANIYLSGRFGGRTLWGVVPAFHSALNLTSGTPIFKNGKLVSVITKSNGEGLYAVSGISPTNGHILGTRIRVRTVPPGHTTYGKVIATREDISKETLRQKDPTIDTPVNTEIYLYGYRIDVVTWNGDNCETLHVRSITPPHDETALADEREETNL